MEANPEFLKHIESIKSDLGVSARVARGLAFKFNCAQVKNLALIVKDLRSMGFIRSDVYEIITTPILPNLFGHLNSVTTALYDEPLYDYETIKNIALCAARDLKEKGLIGEKKEEEISIPTRMTFEEWFKSSWDVGQTFNDSDESFTKQHLKEAFEAGRR